jgi:hypothetical protein
MPESSRQDPSIPLDLRAYVESKYIYAWGVLLTIAVHDRKILKGMLTAEQIAEMSGMGRTKVFEVLKDLAGRGWVQNHAKLGERPMWSRCVPPMSWDKAHREFAKILGYSQQGVRHADGGSSPRERGESATRTGGVRHADGSNIHTRPQYNPPIRVPEAPHPEGTPPKDQEPRGTGKPLDIPAFRGFVSRYGLAFPGAPEYRANDKDYKAARQMATSTMSEESVNLALDAFFDQRTSWHMQNKVVRFSNFVENIAKYMGKGGAPTDKWHEAKCRYYNSWDPRHPKFKDTTWNARYRRDWEEANGRKWGAPPDFDPAIHVDSMGRLLSDEALAEANSRTGGVAA